MSTKPYVIVGPKGREYQTLGGLLRACARAAGNQYPRLEKDEVVVEWPAGVARYAVTETPTAFEVDQQLGWDLE